MLDEVKNTRASLWISASAGTGKTKNLIDRILALLLKGAEPSHILCLTYTKAAAGEMLDRLSNYFNRLQQMSDSEVLEELRSIGFLDDGVSEKLKVWYLSRVRELYNKSSENDWVNIKTIHSFGMDLLKKFPLETGLYPGVKLCDDNQKQQMLEDAFNFVLKNQEFHKDLRNISVYTESILDLIKDNTIIKVRKFFEVYDDEESIKEFFVHEFEADPDLLDLDLEEALQEIKLRIFGTQYKDLFLRISEQLSKGSTRDQEKANYLKNAAELDNEDFMSAVLTKDLSPVKSLCTKKIETESLKSDLLDIQNKTIEYLDEKKRQIAVKVNVSFFKVLNAIIQKFIENKFDQHLIDFDDVIMYTLNLLANNLSWVFYRIDKNIEHVLVDEAQDTSPEQWEIVRRLTSDFFSYEYSEKTIFVVGDEKQSIYSFQGANVDLFDAMHDTFKRDSLECKQEFYDVELNKSYRSEGNVLKFVDRVFKDDFENVKHDTVKDPTGGVVEIVDLFPKGEDGSDHKSYLAEYVAEYIDKAIRDHVAVKDGSRAARPEDFLILFRRRNIETMNLICDELKKRNIPVSGVDRVLLKEEIVVEDLIALAELKTYPLNDLVCACVLKSPVIGMSEDDLMDLCLKREDKHLWAYVLEREDICEKYPIEDLERYLNLDLSVSDFFHYILVDGLREKFLNRLGDKCLTAMEEFLEVCENYQKQYSPNISNFIRWFETNDQTIKKDFIGEGNEVRIMTVHASKGLQAPFVILADAHFEPTASNSIIATSDDRIFWNFGKKMATPNIYNIIEQSDNYRIAESQRLLYVALTRAESYLCILGEEGSRIKNCWYSKVKACVDEFERFKLETVWENKEKTEDEEVKSSESESKKIEDKENTEANAKQEAIQSFGCYRLGNYRIFESEEVSVKQEEKQEIELPEWYYKKFPEAKPINIGEKTPQTEYGDCVHLLLSKIAVHKKPEILIKFANSFNISEEDKIKAIDEAQMVFNKFPYLFDKRSRSEVTLFYKYHEFRIDKIAEIDGETWIIDFKTGMPHEEVPYEYKKQLQNYKMMYRQIAKVNARTAILWTQNLELAEVA